MAIYKNREVSVIGPTRMASTPETIVIQYADGSHETVTLNQVYFSKEEKDNLVKTYPSAYNDVNVASENDLKAVRVGVAPSSDPTIKNQLEEQNRRKQAEEAQQKQVETVQKSVEQESAQDSKKDVK